MFQTDLINNNGNYLSAKYGGYDYYTFLSDIVKQ